MNQMRIKMCDLLVQLLQMAQAGKIDGLVFAAVHQDQGTLGAVGSIDIELLEEMIDEMYAEVSGNNIEPTHEYVGGMLQ